MRKITNAAIYSSAAVLLAACAAQPREATQMISSTQGSMLVRGARVTGVRDVTIQDNHASGIGSIVGTVLGGLAGSTIGGGNGSTVAGIGGAIAGGVAGQQVERSSGSTRATAVTVQFDNGDVRTYQIEPGEQFRTGDHVTVTSSPRGTRITH